MSLLSRICGRNTGATMLRDSTTAVRRNTGTGRVVVPGLSVSNLNSCREGNNCISNSMALAGRAMRFGCSHNHTFDISTVSGRRATNITFNELTDRFVHAGIVPRLSTFEFTACTSVRNVSGVTTNTALSANSSIVTTLETTAGGVSRSRIPVRSEGLFVAPALRNLVRSLSAAGSGRILDECSRIVLIPRAEFCATVSLCSNGASGDNSNNMGRGVNNCIGSTDNGSVGFLIVRGPTIVRCAGRAMSGIVSPRSGRLNST